MWRTFRTLAVLVGIVAAFPMPSLAAQQVVVNRLADGIDRNVGDGVCDASPAAGVQCSLRAAIMEASVQPGEQTIILPAGTYLLMSPGEGEDGAASGDLDVIDTLTITGAGAGITIVDANELDRAFQVHATTGRLSLNKLTIQNGSAIPGSGIHATGTSVRLNGTIVRTNRGSGVEAHGSTLDVLRSTVRDNLSSGIAAYAGSSVRILRSTLLGNQGDYGGALHVDASTATLVNSLITGNSVGHDGGGIYQTSGTLALYNTTVAANDAGRASDFDDLSAGSGGGLYVAPSASATIKNSLLANNGYWIFFEETGSTFIAGECAGPVVSEGYNLVEQTCTLSGDTATTIVGQDPRLVRVKATHPGGQISYFVDTAAITGDSPAIDAADPGGCVDDNRAALTIDLRGAPRPVNGNSNDGNTLRCDIGACEFDGPLIFSLNPTSIVVGNIVFVVTVNGRRFTPTSVVRWNGSCRSTTFVSATQLMVELPASDRQTAGTAVVTVVTPRTGASGGTSNPKTFAINAP